MQKGYQWQNVSVNRYYDMQKGYRWQNVSVNWYYGTQKGYQWQNVSVNWYNDMQKGYQWQNVSVNWYNDMQKGYQWQNVSVNWYIDMQEGYQWQNVSVNWYYDMQKGYVSVQKRMPRIRRLTSFKLSNRCNKLSFYIACLMLEYTSRDTKTLIGKQGNPLQQVSFLPSRPTVNLNTFPNKPWF